MALNKKQNRLFFAAIVLQVILLFIVTLVNPYSNLYDFSWNALGALPIILYCLVSSSST